MSFKVENLEHNMAKLTLEVSAERFDAAVEKVYQQAKKRINIPGFRKGKAPRKMIERLYGKGVFFEDAANECLPEVYEEAIADSDLDIVSSPEFDVLELEVGKPVVFTATVALRPEVTLGAYKGVEIEKIDTSVTDEEVDAKISKEQESNARTISVEDRPVADGDIVTLDYEGSVDGVPFDGGKAQGHALTIGSHSFIEGFEEQVIGHEIGEEFDINVVFPSQYHSEELAGKPAVFKIKIHSIQAKELPALDDEFAQDVSEFDTFAEYRASVEKELQESKLENGKKQRQQKAVEVAVANATMDIPEAMVTTQARQMVNDFARQLSAQGMSMEMYMQYTGATIDQLVEQMRPQAQSRIQNTLVLEAIAKAENVQISDERFEEELNKMATSYKMEVDKLKELILEKEKEQMRKEMAVQEVVELLGEQAVEVETVAAE